MQISKRLSVSGPDCDGDYELVLANCGPDGEDEYTYFNRAEADALIAALTPARAQPSATSPAEKGDSK